MGWRAVVSRSSKLDFKLGYMVIRDSMETVRVHISEISVLIVENTASSVTAALLNELTKQKIRVIFCDEKRNPSSELISYYGSHDTSMIYNDIINNHIPLLVIENVKTFDESAFEKIIIYDNDYCEIVES